MNFESAIFTGGSTMNSAFITENLIDQVIVNIEPAIIGSDIPLFVEGTYKQEPCIIGPIRACDDILQVRHKITQVGQILYA